MRCEHDSYLLHGEIFCRKCGATYHIGHDGSFWILPKVAVIRELRSSTALRKLEEHR